MEHNKAGSDASEGSPEDERTIASIYGEELAAIFAEKPIDFVRALDIVRKHDEQLPPGEMVRRFRAFIREDTSAPE